MSARAHLLMLAAGALLVLAGLPLWRAAGWSLALDGLTVFCG